MKANEAPKNVYLALNVFGDIIKDQWQFHRLHDDDIEYTRTDAFVNKMVNFLNYKLDDVIAIRVGGTIIPHHVAKQELIEDFRKYMKGE